MVMDTLFNQDYKGHLQTAGLTSAEAARRLLQYGPNEVAEPKHHPFLAFLKRYWGPMPWLLEIAAVLALLVGHITEALIIVVLLTINAVIGSVQSNSAARSVRMLKQNLQVQLPVLRDGVWQDIAARELVPGDVITLSLGCIVPADASVLKGTGDVDLSSLTGESLPKTVGSGDLVPSGSVVVRGKLQARVDATGENTTYGKTISLVRDAQPRSHQQDLLFEIVRIMMYVGVAASGVVGIYALITGKSLLSIASLVVTFLMGAVPVALPAVLSIVQAAGATTLSHEGVLVTRLDSVEDAASIDVFCLDKTGTLTKNQLEVQTLIPLTAASTPDEIKQLAAISCDQTGSEPIDAACLKLAVSQDLNAHQIAFSPFDPVTKCTEARVRFSDGQELTLVKGAPRVILARCTQLSPDEQAHILNLVGKLSHKGLRAILLASKTGTTMPLQPVGLLGLADPPREDASRLIGQLQALQIRCVMLTGDDRAIAQEIAAQVGIGSTIIRASDLRKLSHTEQLSTVETADGFAEVLPEDKHRIVSLLQENGHSVGMTGDGVNDAPALRQAELGCAVEGASDIARSSASAVLTTPGLIGLVRAVTESRRAYQRMLTWVINKVTKVIETVVLFTLAYFLTGSMPITLLGMSLLVFANDFATMSIATDNVKATNSPNAWQLRSLVAAASGLGALFALEDLLIWVLSTTVFGLDQNAACTLVVFALVVNSQIRILCVRERNHFWASRPGIGMLVVALLTTALFLGMVLFGWIVPAVSCGAVLTTGVICLVGGIGIDFAKVALFHAFRVK